MSRNPIGRSLACALLFSGLLAGRAVPPAHAQVLEWVRQFGSNLGDSATGLSADSFGNVYVAGTTQVMRPSPVFPPPFTVDDDALIRKYDATGSIVWAKQLGTTANDGGWDISADSLGNAYLGWGSSLDKYSAEGILQWSKQLETSSEITRRGVSADSLGNVFIAGETTGSLDGPNAGGNDVFVSKYDSVGNLQWTRQLGTSAQDLNHGVSADTSGNVYIAGQTFGSLDGANAGEWDAFVSKYDTAGVLQWLRQLGTSSYDIALDVSADSLGNVFISGNTGGSLARPNAGESDAFVSKYNAAGVLQWTRQLGTAQLDESPGVSADGLGNAYISGYTMGSLGGPNAGGMDAFVSKFDVAGAIQWTRQLGASGGDLSHNVSSDRLGNIFIAGVTSSSLDGPVRGFSDAFVAKYIVIPEPASWLLAILASAGALYIGKRRRQQITWKPTVCG